MGHDDCLFKSVSHVFTYLIQVPIVFTFLIHPTMVDYT